MLRYFGMQVMKIVVGGTGNYCPILDSDTRGFLLRVLLLHVYFFVFGEQKRTVSHYIFISTF